MKHSLFFILLLGFISIECSSPKTSSQKIHFDFTIKAFDFEKDQMEIEYLLTNNSNKNLKGGQWSLHWNQILGTPIEESLPEGISSEWVNGQQYLILKFDENWNFDAGTSLRFLGIQKGVINREVMGPMGAFIVNNENEMLELTTKLHWKEAKGIEGLKIPSAEERYADYAAISKLPKKQLSWVVPTPKKMVQLRGSRKADSSWTIFIDKKLQTEKGTIELVLKDQFEKPIQWVSNEQEANFSIKQNQNLSNEAYTLTIDKEQIEISSPNGRGVFYGLQSLDQIIQTAALEQSNWPLLHIEDAPRFGYRGFMLDISRNFYGLKKIKQVIDAMAFYKLNYLDLRLSDDEGWRIKIDGLPELTEIGSQRGYTIDEAERLIPFYGSGAKGGKRGNGFLSKEDFINLLNYANQKKITVMPQISFPSHARAAILSMEARFKKKEGNSNYRLIDPDDESDYRSAQLFDDNVACICRESAFAFYEKVVLEFKKMYETAGLKLKQFSIGADELPYGVWTASPLCNSYMKKHQLENTLELYNHALKRIKNIFDQQHIIMAGWEDFLLAHSEKSQEETQIKEEQFDQEVIPYVWNNIWGEGREDMIYKFANSGFKTVMSNSAAFYFDMTDDRDFENYGLNWSGYVNYKDSWATDPEDVFNNAYLNKKNNISQTYISQKTKLNPKNTDNFLGIQSQLWTETVRNEMIFDALFFPNLIIFSERSWAPRPDWINLKGEEQIAAMNVDWNQFSNTIGQRQLPLIDQRLKPWAYDLPKAGAIIKQNKLYIRQAFPGMEIRYTLDGSLPTDQDALYQKPVEINPEAKVKIRVFNANRRGGKTIEIN